MKKKEDKWVDDLRNRLKDHSEPVPEQLWAELERELNTPKVIPMYRRAGMVAAVAAVAVLTSVSVWWLGRDGGEEVQDTQLAQEFQKVVPAAGQTSHEQKGNVVPLSSNTETSSKNLAMAAAAAINTRYGAARQSTSSGTAPMEVAVASAMNGQPDVSAQASQDEGQPTDEQQAEKNPRNSRKKSDPNPRTYARRTHSAFSTRMVAEAQASHKSGKRWEVGVSLGNVPGEAEKRGAGYQDFSVDGRNTVVALMGAPSFDPSNGVSNYASQVYSELLTRNLNSDVSSRSTHKMPFTVGVSFRWHLTDRWAVESGLTYSKLSSDLWSGTERNYYTTAQKLHYVGIPVKGSYRLWNSRYVAFYASAGGEVEKCVAGSQDRVGVVDGVARTSETKDLDIKQLQWSVLTAVGAEVKATKHLGIYLEPGVHYYFDDGSDISTIRKEHPFNFTLQAGLRLSY